ncbi:MAG: hypothetical protein QOK40_1393, partial [Miltoncostaeaceae bacterium]|nr:hypothetical protein [Miltoncostaeaceae bacterium]
MTEAEGPGANQEPGPPPVVDRLEQAYLVRAESLPPDARLLLLLAAAEPRPALVWRAAAALGIGAEAADAAAAQGL